jgi:hypothetical protein
MSITLQTRNRGRFDRKATLTLGDGQDGGGLGKPITDKCKLAKLQAEKRHNGHSQRPKRTWQEAQAVGQALLTEMDQAVRAGQEAKAVAALRRDRYAAAVYITTGLTRDASRNAREYVRVPLEEGFKELDRMIELLTQKAREAGQRAAQFSRN